MIEGGVDDVMRAEWNRRAREDANYYVAFGRRDQDEGEFFETGSEMATSLIAELRRLPPGIGPRARRALEIGCGPGRLMRPLSRHVGEIHGVDVSDEMIRLARERLRDLPHAHVHHAPGSDLAAFADESFDFVYSYAVFQHIPSREVVLRYLRESRRVLKPGGIARFQLNGLPESGAQYDTWCGVRISAAEVAAFARDNDLQLLALEGLATQYLWTTWRKRAPGGPAPSDKGPVTIRRLTNAFSSEPVAPTRGRFASISLWVENLPPECDLNSLSVVVAGEPGFVSYIGPPEMDGLQQVNALLPEGLGTGLQPVNVLWRGEDLCPPATLRLVPPGPPVPRVVSVSDGVDLLSGTTIGSGCVKVVLEEVAHPEDLRAAVEGQALGAKEVFCTDPRLPKYEVNFRIPENLAAGPARLELAIGRRSFPAVDLEVRARLGGQ
ncbi:MAG: methyltransferase domain-containing protein [Bryobacteraceae bacterium]|nr:methyltransferase domain-containing protein [Bryobacteraceae bacterium]